jgi:hypothetical protein
MKKPNLAEIRLATMKLLLLPDEEDMSEADWEFMRSDLVGEILEGRYPHVFQWVSYNKDKSQ